MTETERVWARIKRTARKLAAKGRIPNTREAEGIVSGIVRDEKADPPPHEAVTYFAGELQGLIERYKREEPTVRISKTH